MPMYITRRELAQPNDLEWVWHYADVPEHLQKPRYVQLADGNWFHLYEVVEDVLYGEIIPWATFKLQMSHEYGKFLRLYPGYLAGKVACVVSGLAAVGALSLIQDGHFQIHFALLFVGMLFLAVLSGLSGWHAYLQWCQIRLLPRYNAGPNPGMRGPRTIVEDQPLRGTGFENPADAVFNMGGRGSGAAGLTGHGGGNSRRLG